MLLQLAGAALAVGLLGGVHCAGMCGGIVGALSQGSSPAWAAWKAQAAYSAGRLTSYAAAGALAGMIGGAGLLVEQVLPVQLAFYLAANVLLVALGLYLAGLSNLVTRLEAPGRLLWRHLQPWIGKLLPADGWGKGIALGMLWGWIPCGLVYTMLATAMLAGDAPGGAAVMLAFGAGTLPNVLGAAFLAGRLRRARSRRAFRVLAGAFVAGFGVFGLAQAAPLADGIRRGLLCIPGFSQ